MALTTWICWWIPQMLSKTFLFGLQSLAPLSDATQFQTKCWPLRCKVVTRGETWLLSKDLHTEGKNRQQLSWKTGEDRVRPREVESHLHFLHAALSAAKARDAVNCRQRNVQRSGQSVPEKQDDCCSWTRERLTLNVYVVDTFLLLCMVYDGLFIVYNYNVHVHIVTK